MFAYGAQLARRLVGEALGAVGAPGASPGRGGRDPKGSSPYRPSPQREREWKKEDSPYRSSPVPQRETQKEASPNPLSATSRRPKSKAWASPPSSGSSPAPSAASPPPAAPLSRLSVHLNAKARRALVPFVAFCGLALGSILGGSLALRFSGKCGASAAECWDLRPRPLTPSLASPGRKPPTEGNRGALELAAALSINDFYGASALQGQSFGAGEQRAEGASGSRASAGAGEVEGNRRGHAGEDVEGQGLWKGQLAGGSRVQEVGGGGASGVQGDSSGSRRGSGHAAGQQAVSTPGGPTVAVVEVLPDEEDSVRLERAVKVGPAPGWFLHVKPTQRALSHCGVYCCVQYCV